MISIRLFKNKLVIFANFFLIGVIITLFGVIQLNRAYALTSKGEQYDVVSIVPFYWMVVIIGGIIIITLTYVSWRKYRGDKKRNKEKSSNN